MRNLRSPIRGLIQIRAWYTRHALICHRNACSPIDQSFTFHGKVRKYSACVNSVYQALCGKGLGLRLPLVCARSLLTHTYTHTHKPTSCSYKSFIRSHLQSVHLLCAACKKREKMNKITTHLHCRPNQLHDTSPTQGAGLSCSTRHHEGTRT